MLGTHNTKEELDNLIGVTILGWEQVDVDYGHSFIALKTNKKFDDSKTTVYLVIAEDAEFNGGGFIGYLGKEDLKSLDY